MNDDDDDEQLTLDDEPAPERPTDERPPAPRYIYDHEADRYERWLDSCTP
jgi:hypothetical protein